MDMKEFVELGDSLDSHWYYLAKWDAIRSRVPVRKFNSSWDIGGGSGFFSRQLLKDGLVSGAASIDTAYEKDYCETVVTGDDLQFAKQAPEAGTPDLMLFMDVIEHVDDDVGLLRDYTSKLSMDGLVVVTVPAFQWLWSGHDVFLEHRRRYSAGALRLAIEDAGLEVVDLRFFYGLLFPVVALLRLTERLIRGKASEPKSAMSNQAPFMNKLLTAIHKIERILVLPWNRFFGVSIICVAKRRAPSGK